VFLPAMWLSRLIAALLLVAVQVPVDAISPSDATQVLHHMVRRNDLPKVKEALQNGADLNDNNSDGRQTPIMAATLSGHTEIAEYLLTLNPDVTIGEQDGYIPTHGAGFQGRAKIMQLLLDFGMDKSSRHKDGFTPIHRACWGRQQRHTDTVEVLLKAGVPYDEPDAEGRTPSMLTQNPNTKKLLAEWQNKADL